MKPELSAAIYAARELAWQPHVNLSDRKRYAHRLEVHQRLVDALTKVTALSANASPELRFLVEAMHRAALCSWANRMGAPYYARKQAMAELRGCLLAYDRSPRGRGVNAITKRIREETRRYAGEVGGGVRLAGVYSFGIEMGLAIAVQAGPRAARLLEELRADVYHGEADRWVIDQADREAAAIAGGRLS